MRQPRHVLDRDAITAGHVNLEAEPDHAGQGGARG